MFLSDSALSDGCTESDTGGAGSEPGGAAGQAGGGISGREDESDVGGRDDRGGASTEPQAGGGVSGNRSQPIGAALTAGNTVGDRGVPHTSATIGCACVVAGASRRGAGFAGLALASPLGLVLRRRARRVS